MAEKVVEIRGLTYAWAGQAPILKIDAFEIAERERVFLRGPSGSGKSTLLGVIAGLFEVQNGHVSVVNVPLERKNRAVRDRLRADHFGVIFQMFNLVPYLSLIQNVALPCRFSKRRMAAVKKAGGPELEARRLLSRLGLEGDHILRRDVTELSVGQQQRVAAARALIGGPSLIIADEPTSALDANTRDRFIELLSEEANNSGASMLFVSHDTGLASLFDRSVDLHEINSAGAETL
ncbi:MAG: ATP-binding cassette domain-containing protein [Pseudomonadota bacterium]